ncbi:MAG: efflux RND transporter permease subunit [Rhodothermales bacterium]
MRITNLAIKYRTSIVVLTVLLVVGGLYSYTAIPKEAQPSIEIPNIVITTLYPGASPDDIETLITKEIEQEVQSVNGITQISSTSTEGVSTIIVEFEPNVSMDEAYQKVRDRVDIAKTDLPDDVEEPMVNEIDLQEMPIMNINLAADYSLVRLKDVAEDLETELEKIPSVLEVDVTGGLEREVQVNVDLSALQGYNLTFMDIVETIQQENTNIPGGSVDVDRLNYLVRVSGQFTEAEEIENLVVSAPDGRPIYVRDVADVDLGFKDRTSYARLQLFRTETDDGDLVRVDDPRTLQVITLGVKQRPGENITEVADAVDDVLAAFPLPSGTRVEITGDMSENVQTLLTDLENNIISGLIFVVAVLLFFLGVRTATLVGIAIPLSMFLSFIVFQSMGYTLNFIILFSLIIALGMLVDNAVVIVENIYRYREMGHSRFDAARLGTAEVGGAVVASTATTVAAFTPMMFWPGIIGEFMSYMPLTLIITLSSSLFVALIVNPVITGIFVRLEGAERRPMERRLKLISAITMVVLAAVIGMANWRTLVVLLLAIPILILLHKKLLKPVGDAFIQRRLPVLVQRYRRFLGWMLERDYTVKRAFLRNTFTLISFTAGFILLVAGMLLSGVGAPVAGGLSGSALLLVVPGGIMLALGVVGIVLHTLESIFLGGWKSVRAGVIFGAVMLILLTAIFVGPREMELLTIVNLMILPAIIVAGGLLGVLLNRKKRPHLILTDNRAKLLTASLGAFVAIILMFQVAPTGTAFFPETDPQQIWVTLEGALGTNLDTSDEIARTAHERILDLLNDNPGSEANVKNVSIGVGVGGDAAFGGSAQSPERSRVSLNMVDYADRQEASSATMTKIREQLQGIPGTEITVEQNQMGPPTGAPVNIEIAGEDFQTIRRMTQDIRQRLAEGAESGVIAGLVDVTDNLNEGRPEYQVNIDRERAAQFGLNTSQIATVIRAGINGIEAGKFRTGEDEYDITVRLRERDRQSLESVKDLTILYEGQQIPITAVADFEVGAGLGSITRLDLQRVATVTGQAAPGFQGPQVLQQVQTYLADYEVPDGYTLSYTGGSEEQQDAFGFLTTALLIAVALIFMIMVAQFNRVSAPFIIMVAVGFSLIGVLLGLIITRTPFGLFTFIGVISLAGIVVNNNIVLIDYIMQLRDRGLDKKEAIIEGGATRLRPVVLTALTTVLGLIPLTFGINVDFVGLLTDFDPNFQFGSENTQFWGPMGTAIIAGLTFGTFLTLVIVPVMYSTFDSISLRLSGVFARHELDGEEVIPESAYARAIGGNGTVLGEPRQEQR